MENSLYEMMGKKYGNVLKDKYDYGMRSDGSMKGSGFFGELKRPDGDVSTELSITLDRDGKPFDIPLLVPTLSEQEIWHLLNGGEPTRDMVGKAIMHATDREKNGLSPYWMPVDKISPYGSK